jgi:hypothetical protein
MSGWGCPHEIDGKCQRINNIPCDPGMKGCVLFGRFRWADDSKNRPARTPSSDVTGVPRAVDDDYKSD